jgi:hypothetical protein
MCDRERNGAEEEGMQANCVRMSDTIWTASDEEGARDCGVTLMIEACVCKE